MDEATCYVFKSKRDRPVKRRRLNDENENVERARRQKLFEREWAVQDARLLEAIDSTNRTILDEVSTFIGKTKDIRSTGKIPTSLITTGLGASGGVFERIISRSLNGGRNVCASLTSADGPNLKTLLKALISRITQESTDDSDDEGASSVARGRGHQLLKYDLQILHEWVALRDSKNVVVAIKDSEAFDIDVLTGFVLLLQTWLSRIPFVLIIGIATSVDMFQERLPSSAIKCMEGSAFDVTETDDVLEQAFKSCTAASGAKLHLGPDLARMMTQRKHDHVQIVEAVRQSVRYAYVSHYYGNPLSVFGLDTKIEDLREQDIEAIRMLPSFRQYIERLLDEKQAAKVRRLLNSNEVLAEELWDAIITANTNLEWLCGALSIIEHVQGHIVETGSGRSALPYFTLYIKALSGSLNSSSPSIRELLLSIEKLDSDAAASIIKYIADTLISMPPSCHDISPDSFSDLQEELSELTQQHGLLKPPSFLNPGTTTISAPSTNLKPSTKKPHNPSKTSGAATRISPHLRSYTTLLTRLHDLLKSFFSSALPTVPFNHPNFFVPPAPAAAATKPHHQLHWNPTEVLFLTTPTRSLLKSAMTPSPRHAIERALSRPHDYLGCACCGPNRRSDAVSNVSAFNGDEGDNGRILAEEKNDHQPATAILYQLYLESGTLINVGDLWMAFRARVSPSVGAATKTNGRDAGWGDGAGGLDGDADGMSVDGSGDQGARGGMDGDGITADDAKGTNSQGRSEHREQMTRALFVRALAELKYLGMIRATRRRNDCVQKVLWKGL